MGEEQFFIGIDLGGTNCRVALLNGIGEIVEEFKAPTPAADPPEVTLDLMAEMIRKIGGAPLAVGAGVPGVVDNEKGIITIAPNLPKWNMVHFADELSKRVSLPVFVGNDVNMMAWGEHSQGAAVGKKYVLCTAIGTGIGGALILDGKLYTGATGTAGEIGHMVYQPNGVPSGSGIKGCLEKYAARDGIVKACLRRLEEGRPSSVVEIVDGKLDKITPKKIAQAANEGDALCREVFAETGYIFGTVLGSVVNLLNVESIIVGGKIANAGEIVMNPIRAGLSDHLLAPLRETVEVMPAQLGEKAGIIGAALWARDMRRTI